MLKLKALLRYHNLSQADLARDIELSRPTISQIINQNIWLKTIAEEEIRSRIVNWLEGKGITGMQLVGIFENDDPSVEKRKVTGGRANARRSEHHNESDPIEEPDTMLLRKQTLTQQARMAFGLFRDPFAEPRSSAELFISPDIRFVRENLYQVTRYGTFMAIVGESGSGKSTIRKDLHARLQAEDKPVIIIEPYILGMEDDDFKGKTLKAIHICEAILATVSPGSKMPRGQEQRFRAVHNALRESHRTGNKHVLIIEEAHALPIPTLKHLKRFFELEDGFDKLLSIVLIGQTELGNKLSENRADVREVVQRCEVIRLNALGEQLGPYLAHRFKLIDKHLADIMDDAAIEALRTKLTISGSKGKVENSVLYPLAVHNMLTAALNLAASVGATRLTPDTFAEV
ncbi:AAA family ATPase [Phytopseudomonas daroniae]|uniref:AAA family ATPase n=1 Tax=Phytopseudomonas daroniae TaxID=2487519 RepID=UPI00103834B2|nr:AAA family ATPase [Pseudomonas daroniae]TBU75225.1 transposase [Pseudomonas daroniae]